MPPQDPTEHADYPGQSAAVTGETAFRLDRWKRAGASDEELAALRDHHSSLAPNQRAFEATAIDAGSDNELTEVLETMRNAEGGPAYTALILTKRPAGPAASEAAAEAEPESEGAPSGEERPEETAEQRDAREAAEAEVAAARAARAGQGASGQGGGPEQ